MKIFLLVFVQFLLVASIYANQPVLRVGAITDNHFDRKRPAMAERTRLAFELFKLHKVDIFVDCGDVVDTYQPEMFKLWREIYLKTFSDEKNRPPFLMIPAGHDRIGTTWEKGYSDFVRLTGSGSVNPVKQIKGYYFVSIAQNENPAILEKNLKEAIAKSSKGQTVFVITHYPPRNTTPGSFSSAGGDQAYRDILDKYPQAIVISGHTHSRLMDARSIWQGNFTAINAGSLAYYDVGGIANQAIRNYAYDASIIEVYKDKVVVRRFDVSNNKEIDPKNPWTWQLPYNPKNAPYNPVIRQKTFPIPSFKENSKAIYKNIKNSWNRWGVLEISLPENYEDAISYKIELKKDNSHYGIVEFSTPQMLEKNIQFSFMAGYLTPGVYTYTITPKNYFNIEGKPLKGKFTVKKLPWQNLNFSAPTPVYTNRKQGKIIQHDKDSFYDTKGDFRLVIPQEVIDKAVAQKKKLILSLDIECIGRNHNSNLRITDEAAKIVTLTTICYRKTSQKQRYSFVFRPRKKQYNLQIRQLSPGKYRFSNVNYFLYQ